jgi:hypothetical protein
LFVCLFVCLFVSFFCFYPFSFPLQQFPFFIWFLELTFLVNLLEMDQFNDAEACFQRALTIREKKLVSHYIFQTVP